MRREHWAHAESRQWCSAVHKHDVAMQHQK
jgi:hypothetical protein